MKLFVVFCRPMRTRHFPFVLLLTTSIAACDDDEGGGAAAGGPDASIAADGGGGADAAPAALLQPPPAGKGIQISMTQRIMAGQETEGCMFYRVGPEGLNIVEEDVRFSAGSHHVLLYLTPYTEVPTRTVLGEEVDTRGVVDCGKNGATGDWNVQSLLGASQTADGDDVFPKLPDGTAVKVPGNAILLVNTHYLNASDKALDASVVFNLHTVPADQVKQEAGVLFFYNRFIRVPPRRESVARMRCPLLRDITVLTASSHMHKRAVGFTSAAIDPMTGAADGIFQTRSWADVPVGKFSPGKVLKAGQLIDFACSYKNDENRRVLQGFTTNDEMCAFAGVYYPKHARTEYCSVTEDGATGRYMGGLWVGEGTEDGKATAECFKAADAVAYRRVFPEDKGESLSNCLYDSCPAISRQVSDVLRCWATQALGMCGMECVNAKDAGCKGCLETRCGPALAVLSAATCR